VKIINSCVFIAATAWGAHASAQMDPNDVASFEHASGTYSVACGKADAARVTVAVDSITIEVGSKRLSGKPVAATGTTFGRGPPPPEYADFQVELMTSITSLYVMEGKEGVYLVLAELEYATHLEKQFGKGTLSGRFKRCS
jgi:hypothetical protein